MGLHRYPTAVEAVEAVREFLTTEVVAGEGARTADQVGYHARVAAHLLAIVERELSSGRGDAWLAERLAELGASDEDTLAATIRAGEWDGREDELVGVLGQITDERLRAANPGHLAPVTDDDPRVARPAG
jgi:hypothetical protein